MESNAIQTTSVAAYEQTNKARENTDALAPLILGGPGLVDKSAEQAANDDGLRPEDVVSFNGAAPQPASPVSPPEVGPSVAQDAADIAIPVDGRGAAVALQEYLAQLQKNDPAAFESTSQALGVQDSAAFAETVSEGSALSTFAQVDSNRILFADANFNEVAPENLAGVANAQLVIKPAFEAPVDVEVKAPEVVLQNPNERLLDRIETPIIQDLATQQQIKQTNPEQLQQSDATATLG